MSRVCRTAEEQATKIVSEIAQRGGLTARGGFVRPVITTYLSEFHEELRSNIEFLAGMKLSDDYLEQEKKAYAKLKPKRWKDTSQWLKDRFIVLRAGADPERSRAITIWLGGTLKRSSLSTGKPLASLFLKAAADRLRLAFPDAGIGLWLNLERKAWDAEARPPSGGFEPMPGTSGRGVDQRHRQSSTGSAWTDAALIQRRTWPVTTVMFMPMDTPGSTSCSAPATSSRPPA